MISECDFLNSGDTSEMASIKSNENEYNAKRGEKNMDVNIGSRKIQKTKTSEHPESPLKKQTRAKARIITTEEAGSTQLALNKTREKVRVVSEVSKDGDVTTMTKKDTGSSVSLKKEVENVGSQKDSIASPKKDGTLTPKKDSIVLPKKDVSGSVLLKKEIHEPIQPKKDDASVPSLKEVQTLSPLKKETESTTVKGHKLKGKISNNIPIERKRDDRMNPSKGEDGESVVIAPEKTKLKGDKLRGERRENGTSVKSALVKSQEIMNSDVSSSADLPSNVLSPRTPDKVKASWSPGDLAWGRVGQHPFWPCMIAVDAATGQFIKSKRVGRGLNSVQESVHVQFFGDNGRHSWISSTCVLKYEGRDNFLKFADKVLQEMKKKDKRYTSAFIVKPSSKVKWEIAIGEAEENIPKSREERIKFFHQLLPKKKTGEKGEHIRKEHARKTESSPKVELPAKVEDPEKNNAQEEPRGARLVRKKRTHQEIEALKQKELEAKKMKKEREQLGLEEENDNDSRPPTRKKRSKTHKKYGMTGKYDARG